MFSRNNKREDKITEPVTSDKQDRDTEPADDKTAVADSHQQNQDHMSDVSGSAAAPVSGPKQKKTVSAQESEAVRAARQAIIERARKDAEEEERRKQEAVRRQIENRKAEQRIQEAQMRAKAVKKEAEEKRRKAVEAEKRVKALSRKQALDEMEAVRKARAKAEQYQSYLSLADDKMESAGMKKVPQASEQEIRDFFGDRETAEAPRTLDEARKELMTAQKKQGAVFDSMMEKTGQNAEKLAEEQHRKLTHQQELLEQEQQKLEFLLAAHKSERLARAEKEKNDRELRLQQDKVNKLKKEKKAQEAREHKEAKANRKKEEKRQKAEARERSRRMKHEAAEKAKLEKERLRKKSAEDAELGGGVVNVKGMKINTKIKKTLAVSLKDFLGFADRKEKKETSEEKTLQMQEEREKKKEKAREAVELTVKKQLYDYERTPFGRKMRRFKNFCEHNKAVLLSIFAVVIMISAGVAGAVNYCMAYEYSYNGQKLGYVKEQDDVLRITDLVQTALTEDKDIDVIIDRKDDIEFKQCWNFRRNLKIDDSEEVLKRLSYMGNLNVKACGIYLDNKKVGAVEDSATAKNVLENVKSRSLSDREGAVLEEMVIKQKWETREGNTDLQDLLTGEEMVDKLLTGGRKKVAHEVKKGDTLANVAEKYSVTEKEIKKSNPDIDPKKLEVGTTLHFEADSSLITVKATEKITYKKKIEHEVVKKKDPELYKGNKEIKQKGKDGLNEVTAQIVLVNGKQIEEIPLVTNVLKEPVKEVVMVGTKKRPPSVGTGKFIWPLSGGYSVTSEFGNRWGRHHDGIDLGCPTGSDVIASDNGVVTYSGYSGAYGNLVIIDHKNGTETRYAHNSSLLVKVGDIVAKGEHIAESGSTGRSTGPHVHFEIRVNGVPQNPRSRLP